MNELRKEAASGNEVARSVKFKQQRLADRECLEPSTRRWSPEIDVFKDRLRCVQPEPIVVCNGDEQPHGQVALYRDRHRQPAHVSRDNLPCESRTRAMRYWWVNQNQTFRQEIQGGYLWSPKRNANGARNQFYESMREVSPGDIVFSFVGTRIATIGIARSYCWESPKPQEFGLAGQNWENIGWKVKVHFIPLANQVRPKDHMSALGPVLPDRFQTNGNGNQGVYLTELPADFAEVLAGLIGNEVTPFMRAAAISDGQQEMRQSGDDLDTWEHYIETQIEVGNSVRDTEKTALIRARRGQGLFKERVAAIESRCRITGVDNPVHLVASHCDSTNEERLDGENGLLLTPSIDHLFDRGFIGFENSGTLIISPVAHKPSLARMGIETERVLNVGGFSEGQRRFLDFHRNSVLVRALR